MLFHLNQTERLASIADCLNTAATPSAAMLSGVLDSATESKIAGQERVADHIAQLIECEAWTDAALELANLCCPSWLPTRLMYDDGEWHCRMSPHRELPDCVGQTIETSHPSLAISLVKAIIEATRSEVAASNAPAMPAPCSTLDDVLLCENFA